jgi:probable HAF family extracellular repeat protein
VGSIRPSDDWDTRQAQLTRNEQINTWCNSLRRRICNSLLHQSQPSTTNGIRDPRRFHSANWASGSGFRASARSRPAYLAKFGSVRLDPAKIFRCAIRLIALVAFAGALVSAATMYTFSDLAPANASTYSRAYSINDRGQIVGFSDNDTGPAEITLWQGTTTSTLGVLDPRASAFDINDHGQVVTMENNAVLINSRTACAETFNGAGLYSSATGINNRGFVVGYRRTAAGNDRALLWNPRTGNGPDAARDLGSIGGKPSDWSDANAINDRNEIVGESQNAAGQFHAFIWNGVMTDIGTSFGANSAAYDVNDKGIVIGWILTGHVTGFLWMNGQITMLPFMPTSINDRGQIVGFSDTSTFPVGTPWLYENGISIDLNTVVPSIPGSIVNVFDINNAGQIVGGYRTLDGTEHGYLLTPTLRSSEHGYLVTAVPEPSTIGLLLFGLIAFSLGRKYEVCRSRPDRWLRAWCEGRQVSDGVPSM